MEDFSNNIAEAFLRPQEREQLAKVVEEVEKQTAGEVVVSIVGKATKPNNPVLNYFSLSKPKTVDEQVRDFAIKHFMDLDIQQTEGATGVLILIAVQERRVEIVADKAINDKVSSSFWMSVSESICEHIRDGNPFFGISRAVRDIGNLLKEHFPRKEDDKNELPDEIQSS